MGANLGSLLLILVASIEYHMNVVVSTGSAIYTQRTKVVVSKYHQIVNLDVSLSYVTSPDSQVLCLPCQGGFDVTSNRKLDYPKDR